MNRKTALILFLLGVAAALILPPSIAEAKRARFFETVTLDKLKVGSPQYLGFMRSTDGGVGTSAGHIHTYNDAGSLPDGGDAESSYYAVEPFSFDQGEFLMVQCGEAAYIMDGTTLTKPAADVWAGAYVAANERYYMLTTAGKGAGTVAMRTADGTAGVCTVFKME